MTDVTFRQLVPKGSDLTSSSFTKHFGNDVNAEEFDALLAGLPGAELPSFDELDRNGDGKVSTAAVWTKLLGELDEDGDKKIDGLEWKDADGTIQSVNPFDFAVADRNKSGEVNYREAAKAALDNYDVDGARGLSDEEAEGLAEALGTSFDEMAGSDGLISERELRGVFKDLFMEHFGGAAIDEIMYGDLFAVPTEADAADGPEPDAEAATP